MIYDEDMRTDNMVRERDQLRFRMHEKINRFMEHPFWNDLSERLIWQQEERIMMYLRAPIVFTMREK